MTGSDTNWQPVRREDVPPQTMEIVQAVVDKLPDLPLSVNKIIEMAADDDTDMGELVELVSSDPTLVSNILRVVNSSYYGLSHKTDNLHQAIVLLGFAEVRKIALKNYVSQTVGGKESKNYDTKQLWEHSYLVSTCAEIYSTEDDQQNRGTLMTLGLMHDVSKFALYILALMLKEKGIQRRVFKICPGLPICSKKRKNCLRSIITLSAAFSRKNGIFPSGSFQCLNATTFHLFLI